MDKRVTDLLGHDRANRGKFIFDEIRFLKFLLNVVGDRDAPRCTLCSRCEFRFSNKEFRSPRIPFNSAGNAAAIVSLSLVSLSTRYDDRLANELATGISTSVSR